MCKAAQSGRKETEQNEKERASVRDVEQGSLEWYPLNGMKIMEKNTQSKQNHQQQRWEHFVHKSSSSSVGNERASGFVYVCMYICAKVFSCAHKTVLYIVHGSGTDILRNFVNVV